MKKQKKENPEQEEVRASIVVRGAYKDAMEHIRAAGREPVAAKERYKQLLGVGSD